MSAAKPSVFSIFPSLARPVVVRAAAPGNRYAGLTRKNAQKELVRRALEKERRPIRPSDKKKVYAASPLGKSRRSRSTRKIKH